MNFWLTLWEFLSKIDVVFSLLAAVFSGIAFVKLLQQNKRLKQLAQSTPPIPDLDQKIKYYDGIQTVNPVALAISLTPNIDSIQDSVQTFLNSQNFKMDIKEIKMNGINSRDDLKNFIEQLRQTKRLITEQHFTELHLFISGPVMAGTIAGAMFDHWIPVKLYHRPTPQPPMVYEYWMPLMK